MKTRSIMFIVGIAAMSIVASKSFAQDAESVVMQFVESINQGNQDAALALVSPDACIGYNDSCFSASKLKGWWQSDIFGVEGKIQKAKLTTDGNEVTLIGNFSSNGWSVFGRRTEPTERRVACLSTTTDDGRKSA